MQHDAELKVTRTQSKRRKKAVDENGRLVDAEVAKGEDPFERWYNFDVEVFIAQTEENKDKKVDKVYLDGDLFHTFKTEVRIESEEGSIIRFNGVSGNLFKDADNGPKTAYITTV